MHYSDFLDMKELKRYANALNTRAKTVQAAGMVDAEMLRSLILGSNGRCEWCGQRIVDADFEIEHIMPLSQHGKNSADNLAVACPDCNRRKAGKHPAKFALEQVAATGTTTALIKHVLEYYGETGQAQQSLFGDEKPASSVSIDVEDDDSPPLQPYRW